MGLQKDGACSTHVKIHPVPNPFRRQQHRKRVNLTQTALTLAEMLAEHLRPEAGRVLDAALPLDARFSAPRWTGTVLRWPTPWPRPPREAAIPILWFEGEGRNDACAA